MISSLDISVFQLWEITQFCSAGSIVKFLKLEFDQMDIIDNIDVIYAKMRIPNSFKKIKVIYVPKKVFYINYYIK